MGAIQLANGANRAHSEHENTLRYQYGAMMSPDDEALLGLADLVVPGLLDYALEGDRGDQVHCANGNWPCHRDHELLTPARGSSQPIPERGPTSVSESPNKG